MIRNVPGTRLAGVGNRTVYTPPQGEALIRKKLANLERFLNQPSALDSLVRMAAAHYQFEAINPFPDGNGRVGRIVNILVLLSYGLLDGPVAQ